jgi:hypothetical protein
MPAPRKEFASCAYMSDIYVFGGSDARNEVHASVFIFDTEANEWSTQAPMPIACAGHSASLINGQVYIVGAGESGREVLRFDFATDAWSTLPRTLHGRESGISFVLNDCLYAAGSGASVERYDIATNTWTSVVDMLEDRYSSCAVCIECEGPTEEQDLFDSLITKTSTQRA